MPIYEFYCADCNTLYSFFSSTVDTERRPDCPRCGRPRLERRPARFAAITRSTPDREEDADPFAELDDERMEAAMTALERELGGMDDDNPDPRKLARALRSVGEAGGIEIGPRMEDVLARLDAGVDPESLEAEMAGFDDEDAPIEEFFRLRKLATARAKRPKIDEELHFF